MDKIEKIEFFILRERQSAGDGGPKGPEFPAATGSRLVAIWRCLGNLRCGFLLMFGMDFCILVRVQIRVGDVEDTMGDMANEGNGEEPK